MRGSCNKIQHLIITPVNIVFAAATTIIVFFINMETGAFATGQIGEQLQRSIVKEITNYMKGKMDPLRIYLQQGVRMFDEMGLNLSNYEDLQQTMPYQRAFLESYFDESRCCSAIFTNIHYDNNGDGNNDVKICHAIENPSCTGTATGSMDGEIASADLNGSSIWAGILHYSDTYATGSYGGLDSETTGLSGDQRNPHSGDFVQVLPGSTAGGPDNTLTFRWYEQERTMEHWNGDSTINPQCVQAGNDGTCARQEDSNGNWVLPVGFVHWPIVDGYWYHDIQVYDLQKGEVRFAARVFPWTLYPPAVLKSHLFIPIHDPTGNKIGGWVTGFKLHWITNYLKDLEMLAGSFVFIVERRTGVLVSSSDPRIKVLKDYTTSSSIKDVVLAVESDDGRIQARVKQVMEIAGKGSTYCVEGEEGFASDNPFDCRWRSIGNLMSRPQISSTESDSSEFLVTEPFEFLGIDWLIVLTIPSNSIMAGMEDGKTFRLVALLGLTVVMKILSGLTLVFLLQVAVERCCPKFFATVDDPNVGASDANVGASDPNVAARDPNVAARDPNVGEIIAV